MKLSVDQALRKATKLAHQGRTSDAEALIRELLQRFPANKRALDCLSGLTRPTAVRAEKSAMAALLKLFGEGKLQEALDLGTMLILQHPDDAGLHRIAGLANARLRRFEPALESFERVLQLQDHDLDATYQRGIALFHLGRHQQALASFEVVLKYRPEFANAWYNRGILLAALNQPDRAIESYAEAIRHQPGMVDAYNNRGILLKQVGRLKDALASFDEVLRLEAGRADTLNNRGAVLHQLGRFDEALASYDAAIDLQPDLADAHRNRGDTLRKLAQLEEALSSYNQALRLNPDLADAHHNRGIVLIDLKRLDQALASFDEAIRLDPNSADHYNRRGEALVLLTRFENALASYDAALRLRPHHTGAHIGRSIVLKMLRRPLEAMTSLAEAIRSNPRSAAAYYCRGCIHQELGHTRDAIGDFERALSADPSHSAALAQLLHLKAHQCDWSEPSHRLDRGRLGVNGDAPVAPFTMLAEQDDPHLHLERARKWAEQETKQVSACFARTVRPKRLRIGYFSADFHEHATMRLMARIFEAHDKSRFELHAFSYGPDVHDAFRTRAMAAFDQFHDVRSLSDPAVAGLSRQLEIDIAIDLKGYTLDSRTGIHAYRAAPLQMSYLGYPGSLGADFIDYIIADQVVIPPELRMFYSEKVICLPHSYQCNDDLRPISPRSFSRAELGLPEHGFVFCCFNNNYKITSAEFDVWMRLLGKVEGSALWLLEGNEWAKANLCREAEARNVDPGRLVFAPRIQQSEHLARHRCADLFLDTFNCNAHTTGSDALWAGLPIVTRLGRSFAARVGSSLLAATGMGELMTHSTADYEALALALATDATRLAAVRAKLAANLPTAPLFDSETFTRHLERAFDLAFARYAAGLPPDHIQIGDESSGMA